MERCKERNWMKEHCEWMFNYKTTFMLFVLTELRDYPELAKDGDLEMVARNLRKIRQRWM